MEYVPKKAEGYDVFEKLLGWGFGGPGCIQQFRVNDEGSFWFHGGGLDKAVNVTWAVRDELESGVSEFSDGRDLALSLSW